MGVVTGRISSGYAVFLKFCARNFEPGHTYADKT